MEMRLMTLRPLISAALLSGLGTVAPAQRAYTWQELRDKFLTASPTLVAGRIGVSESRAQEITAFLRPNPDFTFGQDGTQLAPSQGVWRPFSGTQFTTSFSYLHERRHKRELRLESAQKGTAIAESQQADLERNQVFTLRNSFVQVLQAKAVLALAQESLAYYNRVLSVSGDRFRAGDIARVDLLRLQVGQAQYEADVQTAQVNLRTAKIQLLQMLNERTPVEQFDVAGPFTFTEPTLTLDELHRQATASRPDLQAAERAIEKANADYRLAVANGSTDPTFSVWWTHNPSFNNLPNDASTIGASVSIPLRIFDRNQGEKARTRLDISHAQRLRDAAAAQVLGDVDSAYATVNSNVTLLKRYRTDYLEQASTVRDTISFSYQRGGASLLDFLAAESDYRAVRLGFLNLVGSFLTAANQLNLAVGREVI
jgi:cobalt-zinc-cadmium efflux system outer membrane protein